MQKQKRLEFTQSRIEKYISVIQSQIAKDPQDYYILRKFAIRTEDDENQLIERVPIGDKEPRQFVAIENVNEYIESAHKRLIHAGIKKTFKFLKTFVANIKFEQVDEYIRSKCKYCINRRKSRGSRRIPVKSPIISSRFGSRAQMDLIDIRYYSFEGNVSYILNYQDNLTRFCILKLLSDKTAGAIIDALREIFCLWGPPKILHTDNGGEFRNKELGSYIQKFWPDIVCVRGKPYNPRSQGAVERANQDIKRKLEAIIAEGGSRRITEVVSYVQFLKNTSHNRTIACTPFKAVFGCDPQVQLRGEELLKGEIQSCSEEISVDGPLADFLSEEKKSLDENIAAISSRREQVLEATKKAAQKMMMISSHAAKERV